MMGMGRSDRGGKDGVGLWNCGRGEGLFTGMAEATRWNQDEFAKSCLASLSIPLQQHLAN